MCRGGRCGFRCCGLAFCSNYGCVTVVEGPFGARLTNTTLYIDFKSALFRTGGLFTFSGLWWRGKICTDGGRVGVTVAVTIRGKLTARNHRIVPFRGINAARFGA